MLFGFFEVYFSKKEKSNVLHHDFIRTRNRDVWGDPLFSSSPKKPRFERFCIYKNRAFKDLIRSLLRKSTSALAGQGVKFLIVVGRDLSWEIMSVFVSCFGKNKPENISSQLENAGYSLDVQKTTTNNRKRPNDFQISKPVFPCAAA